MKKLVIVESRAKARTLASVLGQDYTVRASLGHVGDPSAGSHDDELGVDLEHGFKPNITSCAANRKIESSEGPVHS